MIMKQTKYFQLDFMLEHWQISQMPPFRMVLIVQAKLILFAWMSYAVLCKLQMHSELILSQKMQLTDTVSRKPGPVCVGTADTGGRYSTVKVWVYTWCWYIKILQKNFWAWFNGFV